MPFVSRMARSLRLLLGTAAVLLITLVVTSAQTIPLDATSAGRTYVLAFPDTTTNLTDPRFAANIQDVMAVFLYAPVETSVQIKGLNYNGSVTLKAGKFQEVYLRNSNTLTDSMTVAASGRISNSTFRVEADHPVVLYCYIFTQFGGEMWTPVPVERWGKEYYVAVTPGETVVDESLSSKAALIRKNKAAPAEAMVIAAYDHTNVTIYPTGTLLGSPRLSVELNAGQAYQVQSFVDTTTAQLGQLQPDLGGSLVVADRPVAVISGNTRAQVIAEPTIYVGNALKNMTAEWLAPAEQFGTEFVYTPTWDTRHITGVRNEKLSEKRGFEVVRVYGASQAPSKVFFRQDSTHVDTTTVSSTVVHDFKTAAVTGKYIRSEKPVQVMMHSTSVARLVGTLSTTVRTNYETWGAYQLELVPREQWSSFAPIYAPSYPYETKHYVNVIADTSALDKVFDENGTPFDFNMGQIRGTGMMWGTMQISAGATHYFEGREGARFFAYVYGLRSGLEYWAGKEFQEVIGISYGYPAGPARRLLRNGDSLRIDTVRTACDFHVKVRAVNSNALGLQGAELQNPVNARFSTVAPLVADGLTGFTQAEFSIVPLDASRDASATLLVTDRSGKAWHIPYTYVGERAWFNAGVAFDLGDVSIGETKDTVVVISNTSARDICVRNLRLAVGTLGISIVGTEPAGPALLPATTVTLAPGDSLRVLLRAAPVQKDRVYHDSLRIALCCTDTALTLRLGAVAPCVNVNDLDFGRLTLNQERSLTLRICNDGGGVVTLANPAGDSTITWIQENFTIAPADLLALKNLSLAAGQCADVPVSFSSPVAGVFRGVARVWANTRDCRDTSVWTAVVTQPQAGVDDAGGTAGFSLTGVHPNPVTGQAEVAFSLPRGVHTTVAFYNTLGARVDVAYNGMMSPGAHNVIWNARDYPPGVYFCRVTAGSWTATTTVTVVR